MINLNVGDLNVRGLNDKWKRKRFFNSIRKRNFDVFMCQETHSDDNTSLLWEAEWGRRCIFSNGCSSARGVAMFFGKKFTGNILDQYVDKNGRVILVKVEIDETTVVLGNIYAPNKGDVEFVWRPIQG